MTSYEDMPSFVYLLIVEIERLVEDYLSCPQTRVMVDYCRVSSSLSDLEIRVWVYNPDYSYNLYYYGVISSECREEEVDGLAYEIFLSLVYES